MGRGNYKKKTPIVETENKELETINVETTPEFVEIPEVSIEEPVEIQIQEPVVVVCDNEQPGIIQPIALYKVKVIHPYLQKRVAPNLNADIFGFITDKGTYDIFAEEGGWGRLEDNSWIKLEFTEKL